MRIELYEKDLGLPGLVLFGMLDYTHARGPMDMHVHEDIIEICYLARGRQTYVVEDKEYGLSGGDVFIAYPGQVHGTGHNPEEKSLLYWIQIDLNSPEKLLGLPADEALAVHQGLLTLTKHHFHAPLSLYAPITEALEHYYKKPLFYRSIIRGKLIEYIALVCTAAQRDNGVDISREIKKVVEYIEISRSEWPVLPDLAEQCGLSLPRFKSRFRAEIGMPPGEYITRIKVTQASKMIQEGIKVTDTAYALGFSSSQYMATVFRKITGKTPSQYIR